MGLYALITTLDLPSTAMDDRPAIIPLQHGLESLRLEGTSRYKRIASDDFRESFSASNFMNLVTIVYSMCTQPSPHVYTKELYQEYGDAVKNYVTDVVVSRLSGKHDQFLLQTLVKEQKNFTVYVRMMKNAFEYLNRFYVVRNRVPRLEHVGILVFVEEVFTRETCGEEISRAALKLVKKDRDGEQVDRVLLRSVSEIYRWLDFEPGVMTKYEEGLEMGLIEDTKSYYASKSADWLNESLPEYLIKVEKVLAREQQFCEECLSRATLSKLEHCLDEQLLIAHQTSLLERESGGFSSLLADMRKEDLKRMFTLFNRVENGLEPLSNLFCTFVQNKGQELVDAFDSSKSSNADTISEFVKKMIHMHDAYHGLLLDCFDNSGLFSKALKKAFSSFLNQDLGGKRSKVTFAEVLSAYCDSLLKASGEKMGEEQLEQTLRKVVALFNYLSAKDLFSEYYRKQLARRLLMKKSASDDAEFRMLELLKAHCGAQFTSKLEGMVKDLVMSKENQRKFKDYANSLEGPNRLAVDFEIQVLTTGYWPKYPLVELVLPDPLVKCMGVFKEFYETETRHRKLRWLHGMGQVTMQATYSKKYDLMVSTPQASILMLFNTQQSITFDQVPAQLNLQEDEAKRQLLTLTAGKFKLLKKDPPGKTISPGDKFFVNPKFSADKKRIKVPTISSKELNKEDKESASANVNEDRKHAIEAAIVRIMKARKQLEFQKLVMETTQQLSRVFKPDVKLIKSRMEDLIQREYLERDPNNARLLRYLA